MNFSIFELFNIGIGPSSSHAIGPMRAAYDFIADLRAKNHKDIIYITTELYGSLAYTNIGHGTNSAIILGFAGYRPDEIDPLQIPKILSEIDKSKTINTGNGIIHFVEDMHILKHLDQTLPFHSNAIRFNAYNAQNSTVFSNIYYSTGGGFIVKDSTMSLNVDVIDDNKLKYPFETMAELLLLCEENKMSIADIVHINELAWHDDNQIQQQALKIWDVMQVCIEIGCNTSGELPGGLKVKRRAKDLYNKIKNKPIDISFLDVYALAVNEENAAGSRVVTAPTNGSAGIIPSVLKYYQELNKDYSENKVIDFILTAGAIGILFKKGASISGAEMGCQGEVGVASSMAAGALCAIMGGNIYQIEQAAEIAIEHNLGLTCDPIKGLVQIPCIERNAMGAVKAVNAATIALLESGSHIVSLDNAIKTMKATGRDMSSHYKETSQGGLAVNVPEC